MRWELLLCSSWGHCILRRYLRVARVEGHGASRGEGRYKKLGGVQGGL